MIFERTHILVDFRVDKTWIGQVRISKVLGTVLKPYGLFLPFLTAPPPKKHVTFFGKMGIFRQAV